MTISPFNFYIIFMKNPFKELDPKLLLEIKALKEKYIKNKSFTEEDCEIANHLYDFGFVSYYNTKSASEIKTAVERHEMIKSLAVPALLVAIETKAMSISKSMYISAMIHSNNFDTIKTWTWVMYWIV